MEERDGRHRLPVTPGLTLTTEAAVPTTLSIVPITKTHNRTFPDRRLRLYNACTLEYQAVAPGLVTEKSLPRIICMASTQVPVSCDETPLMMLLAMHIRGVGVPYAISETTILTLKQNIQLVNLEFQI